MDVGTWSPWTREAADAWASRTRAPCPGCSAQTGRLRFRRFGYRIVECCACGLVYCDHVPSTRALVELYSDGYFTGRTDLRDHHDYRADESVIKASFLYKLDRLTGLVIASIGVIGSPRRDRYVLAGILLLGLALAIGGASPVYRAAYAIVPFLGVFRAPARFLLWFTVAAATLGAFGLEALAGDGARPAAARAVGRGRPARRAQGALVEHA